MTAPTPSPEDEDLAAFSREQAAARRKRLVLAAVAGLGVALAAALAVRASASSHCEALATQLCGMGGVVDCSPLRRRLAAADADRCASTLAAMQATSDRSMKLAIASRALAELVPETGSLSRVLEGLPPDKREAFLKQLQAAPPQERQRLMLELTGATKVDR